MKFHKDMTEAEQEAYAADMCRKVEAAVAAAKRVLTDHANECDVEVRVAFMIDATLELASAALNATASGLETNRHDFSGEGQMALAFYQENIVPEIVRIAKAMGLQSETRTMH